MKKLILLASFLTVGFGASTAFAQHTVEIKGKVKFIDDNFKMTVYQRDGFNRKTLAETIVNPDDHTYQMQVTVDKPGVVALQCGGWQSVDVWAEDENMEVDFRGVDTAKVKIKNPPYVYIKAGKKNELMNKLNFESYRNYQNMIAISQITYRSKIEDAKEKQNLSFSLYDMNNENTNANVAYLVEHYADCTSVIAAIKSLNSEKYADLIETALNTLERENPGTTLASDYREQARIAKEKKERMKEGNPAPAISLPDAKGKLHTLKEFKGKVLVIDFWASWCGPCRKEIPNIKQYYQEFKEAKKDVAFLSISIDGKKADWEKAMKEENMEWLQLLAPNAGKEVMEDYQFHGIPFIIVLDKEGNIYKKNLRGEAIRHAVNDVLDGKKAEAPKTIGSVGMSMGIAM